MLTATPINNSLLDFQHMVELFSRHRPDHFSDAPLGIHSLIGHIRQLERSIERQLRTDGDDEVAEINAAEIGDLFSTDSLLDAPVVQRSRSYVKASMREGGSGVIFPEPRKPKVTEYSVKQTYGKLLDMVADAFHKRVPLFTLGIYNPYAYYKGDDPAIIPAMEKGRRKQVVALIRTNFLKRFESSAEAFRLSCWRLLYKLLAWLEVNAASDHEKDAVERWKRRNGKLIGYKPQLDFLDEAEGEEDLYPEELRGAVEKLPCCDFDIEKIVHDTIQDLDQLADFLNELEMLKPFQDKKLNELKKLLKNDPILKDQKVIIFSEFGETARYVAAQLKEAGIEGVDQIDSGTKGDRSRVIQRFAPYYNESSSADLGRRGLSEIRVLISTDVLSEGLNLQDATRLINYDLHWNPVRLMQRIGRVDRRMNSDIEKKILADHPNQKNLRGTVGYWNFLPPDDLDDLLRLYNRVSHKTLRISKTLGIEGKKLLREDDDYEDLRNFAEQYEGTASPDEQMHLEWQDLLATNPQLEAHLSSLPDSLFSGKKYSKHGARGVFFCYSRPAHDRDASERNGQDVWSAEAGDVKWYLADLDSDAILEDSSRIIEFARCDPETPRRVQVDQEKLSEVRKTVEKHIAKTYLRKVQAPVGVKPILKAWMELN